MLDVYGNPFYGHIYTKEEKFYSSPHFQFSNKSVNFM